MATTRHRKPENFLAAIAKSRHGIAEERPLSLTEQASEALLVGLRLVEGIDMARIEQRFGIASSELIDHSKLELHQNLGLVWRKGDRIGLTREGMPLLDALLSELVADQLVSA